MLDNEALFRASAQDGSYPRPQLVRRSWRDLCGEWSFARDDDNVGLAERWGAGERGFGETITVPFPPESAASGVADTGYHPVVWYQRSITPADLAASGRAGGSARGHGRVILHFGAVDYRATVWVDGHLVGSHEGGQTPFSFDITEHTSDERDVSLVVRAEDDPLDVEQPRGKQDWLEEPHVIWYHRTTGIWQPVWLETVPSTRITALHWTPDVPGSSVRLDLELDGRPTAAVDVRVRLSYEGTPLADQRSTFAEPRTRVLCALSAQTNGQSYESLLWSPEHPRLIDAHVTLLDADGTVLDEVWSYLGLVSVGVAGDRFMLNDRPYFVRSVLEQGYWPESHLAAPSAAALRDEVQLIKDLGFNAARIHEKVEDPRFLYWADRLGMLVWGEMGSPFQYSATAARRVATEWVDAVNRDRSHPSIVTWVPINESWGVQHVAHDSAQLHFVQAMYHLTKAIDPSRLVVSNDGWEHATSDLLTVHDYATTGEELRANYRDDDAIGALIDGVGPAGRRLTLVEGSTAAAPLMVSEFGGISFAPNSPIETWGYSTETTAEGFAARAGALFDALRASDRVAGFCYTQLTDTLQEANGLTDEHRVPKLPVAAIRAIVRGDDR